MESAFVVCGLAYGLRSKRLGISKEESFVDEARGGEVGGAEVDAHLQIRTCGGERKMAGKRRRKDK